MIQDIALGFALGFVQVGAGTWRTIEVFKGRYVQVWVASSIISIAYFFGTMFIVNGNVPGYIGFSIGAATITSWMAAKNAKNGTIHHSDDHAARSKRTDG